MATKNPPDCFPATSPKAVFLQGLDRILAAGRREPTGTSQQRADAELIAANQQNGKSLQHV